MDPLITISVTICMSLLFGAAAVQKMRLPQAFRSAVADYRIIPAKYSGLVSKSVIMAEMVAALLVLIAPARHAGLILMAGLLLLYATAIGVNLYRGRRDLDCGCGGQASSHKISGWLVLRNLLLLGLVLLALAPSAPRPLNWLDLLTVTFGIPVASGLYLGVNQLLAQAPRISRLRTGA